MVNCRYEERISGATIEASILRSKEEGLYPGSKSEGFTFYIFLRDHEETVLRCFLELIHATCNASCLW
jgi:hypothetical protein